MGNNALPPLDCKQWKHYSLIALQKFIRENEQIKKPNVPKATEKPQMNQQSNRNFILSNAVENILIGTLCVAEKKYPSAQISSCRTELDHKEGLWKSSQIFSRDKPKSIEGIHNSLKY